MSSNFDTPLKKNKNYLVPIEMVFVAPGIQISAAPNPPQPPPEFASPELPPPPRYPSRFPLDSPSPPFAP